MPQTSIANRPWAIPLVLVVLMGVTRGHHFGTPEALPDASWAVFFLAGVFARPLLVFALLCAASVLCDWIAIDLYSVPSFCVTPAYAMLLPAYAALWSGGRFLARRNLHSWSVVAPLVASVLVSSFAAELLSSGGFYFLGGRFPDPTLEGFLPRLGMFYPGMLAGMSFYVGLAAVVFVLRRATARTLAPGARP
jgi:hypothetical protein